MTDHAAALESQTAALVVVHKLLEQLSIHPDIDDKGRKAVLHILQEMTAEIVSKVTEAVLPKNGMPHVRALMRESGEI